MRLDSEGNVYDDGYFHNFDQWEVPGAYLTPLQDAMMVNMSPLPIDIPTWETILGDDETREIIASVYGCSVDMVDEIVQVQLKLAANF